MSARAKRIIEVLMRDCRRTFAEELGIRLDANDPAALFRLLCACLLFSTRISHAIALKAAGGLFARGWTTPQKLLASTWGQRVRALDEAGYVRYDERTSTMLGEMAELLLRLYNGDLGKLRENAGRQPHQERELLKEFRGIGDVAVDIFLREIQVAWPEIFPYVDRKAAESAARFGLKADLKTLAGLKTRDEFARLVAALVRVQLTHRHDEILKEAGGSPTLRAGGRS